MTAFERKLGSEQLEALSRMAGLEAGNWWKDVLNAWAPAGRPLSGRRKLRLAVRNNYLNFYCRGQSIAKVSFGRGVEPRLETHIKYAVPGAVGQSYGRLITDALVFRDTQQLEPVLYKGRETLDCWILAASKYQGSEKDGVEQIVANNEAVIDLEMGLPAWEGQAADASREGGAPFAPRLDLVALEPTGGGQLSVVFWEAKTVRDARLRSSKARPEVLRQLEMYERYLSNEKHQEAVLSAYRNACRVFIDLHAMAAECSDNPLPSLSDSIRQVGSENAALSLDLGPRLAIFAGSSNDLGRDSFESEPKNWSQHFAVLTGSVPLLYVRDPRDIKLDRAALWSAAPS